jgi:L-gulonolactone oxidase
MLQSLTARRSVLSRLWSWLRDRLFGFHLLQLFYGIGLRLTWLVPYVNRLYQRTLFDYGSNTDEQVGEGPSMLTFDCSWKQYTIEWSIPIERTAEAMVALRTLIEQPGSKFRGAHFPVEIRFSSAERAPMLSPAYERDSCWIGLIVYKSYGMADVQTIESYFLEFEMIMVRLGGRPHWAKGWHRKNELDFSKLYPRFDQFREIRNTVDPHRMFTNDYVARIFGEGQPQSREGHRE